MKIIQKIIGLWFAAIVGATPAFAQPAGPYDGFITYNDKPLGVRVGFESKGGLLKATLDIPSLVYAEQGLEVGTCGPEECTIGFPFGLGEFTLNPAPDGTFHGSRGKISITLTPGLPVPYEKQDIQFESGQIRTEGTLYLPKGEGPFPTVVIIAGSGQGNRQTWSYASWADFFARRGYAAFIYDRPGDFTKKNDGSFYSIPDHAELVAAAVGKLKTFPGIDPDRIGLKAHSRGSWLALAAANLSPDIQFLILGSMAVATPAEQEVASVLTGMEQDGLSSQDLSEARAYLRLYFYVAQTGQGWDLLAAAIENGPGKPWFQYVDQPQTLEDLQWWKLNMNFDPRPILRALKTPILALWGDTDFIAPWRLYSETLKLDASRAGNPMIQIRVIPRGDHRLETPLGTDEKGEWQWFGIGEGVFDGIDSFLSSLQMGPKPESDS